jgi:hypothetical protein
MFLSLQFEYFMQVGKPIVCMHNEVNTTIQFERLHTDGRDL